MPEIITGPWTGFIPNGEPVRRIALKVGRATLSKRRWRGVAEDGRDIGFDLQVGLEDQTVFLVEENDVYFIDQLPEPVLETPLPEIKAGVQLAWNIGNLHFPVEIAGDVIRTVDDPAMRQLFERLGIQATQSLAVFHPARSAGIGHSHAHGHGHSH